MWAGIWLCVGTPGCVACAAGKEPCMAGVGSGGAGCESLDKPETRGTLLGLLRLLAEADDAGVAKEVLEDGTAEKEARVAGACGEGRDVWVLGAWDGDGWLTDAERSPRVALVRSLEVG